MSPLHNHLRVHNEVQAKEERAEGAHKHLEEMIVEEEARNADHEQGRAQDHDETHLARKVRIGGVDVDLDSCSDSDCHETGKSGYAVAVLVEGVQLGVVDVVLAEAGHEVSLTRCEYQQ